VISSLNLFSTVLAAGVASFLGAIVYTNDRKSTTNIAYAILAGVFSVWTFVNHALLIAGEDSMLFWIRVLIILTPPQVLLLLFFIQHFPKKSITVNRQYIVGIIALTILMMWMAGSSGLITSVTYINGNIEPVTGSLMPVFISLVVFYSLITLIIVFKKFREANYVVRRQWFTISTGFVTSYGLLIFLVILRIFVFNDNTYVAYAPIFLLPIFVSVGYAILKRNVFNLKVVGTQILVFIVLAISFIEVLLSNTSRTFAVSAIMAGFIMFFGLLLVKGVLDEIKSHEEMEKLTNNLREANKVKSQFLSFASHQVKAPMTVVKGYATLLTEGSYGKIPVKAKETAQKIYDSADKLINLVNDLLDIRKLEAGKVAYEFAKVDLSVLLKEIYSSMKPLADAKRLEFAFQDQPDGIFVKADKNKIEQVFRNLIDNAVKYTDKGWIKMELDVLKDKVAITVSDSGRGMDPETLDKLFDQFTRAKNEKIKGTGLGLFIAKKFVKTHGGTIRAQSLGIGKGSNFTVQLPKFGKIKDDAPA
jgi:signal transduction histidine kinase